MGAILGVALLDGGADVALVDVSVPVVERIRGSGVTLRRSGDERVVRVTATSDPGELEPVDYLVFLVKCYHTAAAADLAASLCGAETCVVSMQNGWGNADVLAERFGSDRVLVGVTYNSGTVIEPGVVAHTGQGVSHVGTFDGADLGRASAFASLLTNGGLPTDATPGIEVEIWKKLILNAATLPTAALTGLTAGAVESFAGTRSLVDALADEAIAVGQARGFAIDGPERLSAIHATLERAGAGKPSMLQDFEAGRRTEIDVINGAVIRAAELESTEVPVNRAALALVKGWELARGLG
jgi:2-dehydropantoate 2-reductase